MPNILEIKHGNAVPIDGDLEPYELGYCDSNGFLYIGKQSEEGEKKVEEIKLPTNYYTILYGSDNYLDNSLTTHYIDLNDPGNRDGVITTTDASTIASLPPTLTGPFCAYKKTFLQKRKDEQGYYNMFQILFEMYPVRGRIWTNAFSFEDNEQGQWGAWKAASFLDYNSFDNYNLSLGHTETANKESGISIYRKDANGILKLGRFYMEDYSGTSSLSLVQTSALNGTQKSAVTLRMNWSGEDFRLISQADQTGGSYIGEIMTPWTGIYALSYNSGSWNGNTIPITKGGTSATAPGEARRNLGVPAITTDMTSTPNQLIEPGFHRVGVQSGVPHGWGNILTVRGAGDQDAIAQISFPYQPAPIKVRYGNPPETGGTGTWTDWYTMLTTVQPVGIDQGGTSATDVINARYNLNVPTEVEVAQTPGFPFARGMGICRGGVGNTAATYYRDNYYLGVDSDGNLWRAYQINGATSPNWCKAMLMDGAQQNYITIYSGTLTSGSAAVKGGNQFAAWMIAARPGAGEDMVVQCVPAGKWEGQIASNNHWLTYRIEPVKDTIRILSNPDGGAIRYIWGLLRCR